MNTRVLMVLQNYPFPQDARVRPEAIALARAGHEVTVISPARKNQPRRETFAGVRVYRYPEPTAAEGVLGYLWEYGYSLAATFWLSLVVWFRHGFDIIHAHNPPDLFALLAVFYRPFGKRYIFDHHDLAPEMYRAKFPEGNRLMHWALLFFEKLSYRMAAHVIVTNQSYKQTAMTRGRVPEERITVARNGPDFNHVRRVPPDSELRSRASTILGYLGLISRQDGLDYLLRAVAHLVHDLERHDVLCMIVGDGEERGHLEALVQKLRLDDYVWFAGYHLGDDLCRLLSTADIFVAPEPSNPYNDKSTMIKMMEYMYLGRPIVAFDLTEHRASAAGAALYARANDEADFARLIARLMDDSRQREELGRIGRQRVETSLAWHHQAPKLLAAYRSLASDKAADRAAAAPTHRKQPSELT